MSIWVWICRVVDVVRGCFPDCMDRDSRRSVWSRRRRFINEVQLLEPKVVLSAGSLSEIAQAGSQNAAGDTPIATLGTCLDTCEVPAQTHSSMPSNSLWGPFSPIVPASGIFYGAGDPPGGDLGADLPGVDGDAAGGDLGAGFCGVSDIPWPDGGADSGDDSGVGGTDAGGDYGGSADVGAVEVEMELPTQSWFEGPFTQRKLDRQKLVFTRTDLDGDGQVPGVTATVEFPTDQLLNYAEPGADYVLKTESGEMIPLSDALPGQARTAQVQLVSPDGRDVFYLVALMDGDYEDTELVEAQLTSVVAHSMTESAQIGNSGRQSAALADGSADLDVASLDEDAEDKPGHEFLANKDDDNDNEQPDSMDQPVNLADDDLVPLTIRPMLEGATDYDQAHLGGGANSTLTYLVLVFPSNVRIYTSNRLPVESGVTQFSDSSKTSLWMEGLAAGHGEVSLRWQVRPMVLAPGSDVIIPGDVIFDTSFDSIAYTVRTVDLDIDSDNDNQLSLPAKSDWEEILENHTYGIGKLIYPTPMPASGVFDSQVFTPMLFESPLLDGDDPDTVAMQFDFPSEQGQSGYIKVWTVPSNSGVLRDYGVESGGHRITPGRRYSASELSGVSTLWLQAVVAQTGHNTRAGADRQKPDDRIRVTVYRRDTADSEWKAVEGLADEVKYMVNLNDDVFYPNLQFDHGNRYWKRAFNHTGMVLRDSLAAEGVYNSVDFPQFGLELLDGNQMRRMGLSEASVVQIELSQAVWSTGLRVAIYRDYLSPGGRGYILAFAGTQMELADIIADLTQGLGLEGTSAQLGYEPQYTNAMRLGSEFSQAAADRQLLPRTTGHSLGGGLASAASVAAQNVLPAAAFNAAGLHRDSLMIRSNSGRLTETEKFDGSLARFLSGANIVNYYTEFDPLTFMQNNMPAIPYIGGAPKAIGKQVQLQAPYDGVVKAKADALLNFMRHHAFPVQGDKEPYSVWWQRFNEWLGDVWSYTTVNAAAMLPHHKMRFVQFGLMVHQASNPSMPNSRVRTWDIFGDIDPK